MLALRVLQAVCSFQVTEQQRGNAKALAYGLLFGKGAHTTANDLGVLFCPYLHPPPPPLPLSPRAAPL